MTLDEHFTEDERAMLEEQREKYSALGREVIATPRWRVFRLPRLREEWELAAATYGVMRREVEQAARDRLLARRQG